MVCGCEEKSVVRGREREWGMGYRGEESSLQCGRGEVCEVRRNCGLEWEAWRWWVESERLVSFPATRVWPVASVGQPRSTMHVPARPRGRGQETTERSRTLSRSCAPRPPLPLGAMQPCKTRREVKGVRAEKRSTKWLTAINLKRLTIPFGFLRAARLYHGFAKAMHVNSALNILGSLRKRGGRWR